MLDLDMQCGHFNLRIMLYISIKVSLQGMTTAEYQMGIKLIRESMLDPFDLQL